MALAAVEKQCCDPNAAGHRREGQNLLLAAAGQDSRELYVIEPPAFNKPILADNNLRARNLQVSACLCVFQCRYDSVFLRRFRLLSGCL